MSTLIQRSFTGGEISPSMYPRVDLVKYLTGLKTCRNGFIGKGGGYKNRPGSFLVNELIGTSYRFIPWEATDVSDSYVLVFSSSRIRFIQNGQVLTVDTPPAAWNIATPYVVGDLVQDAGAYYYCILDNTGNIPPNATYWLPLINDPVYGWIYEIPSPIGFNQLQVFQYVQDLNKMTVVNSQGLPTDIVRNSHLNWVIDEWPTSGAAAFLYGLPSISPPTVSMFTTPGAGHDYCVTSVAVETFEESLRSNIVSTTTDASPGTPVLMTWGAVTGAYGYNVYRLDFGKPRFLNFVQALSFTDLGFETFPDSESVPEPRAQLNDINPNRPNRIGLYQQRTAFGNFQEDSAGYFLSQIGNPRNFTRKFPAADDDSIGARIKGRSSNAIKHFIDLGYLIIMTESGEWIIKGGVNGVLKADTLQPEQYSYNGASDIIPIVANTEAIYVQQRGSIVRAIGFDSDAGGRDGYRDDDLTVFASHLFKNKTITSLAYQQTPDSVVWMTRDDGTLLAVTYNRAQQILAWSRHDTDGFVRQVVSVQEGLEHAIYIFVTRTINGVDRHFIERFHDRDFTDIVDAVFLDSSLSYDGRNTTATTMTVSGGTAWDETETQTMTASAGFFVVGDVGNQIHLTDANGVKVKFTIEAYTSPTVVTVRPDKSVPVAMQSTALDTWAKAVDNISGLDHLEGKDVSVFADGYVVASPNNAEYGAPLTVTAGAITLPEPYAVVHVGLPYISDIETLDIDTVNGETLINKKIMINKVNMHVEETRGLFVGGRVPTDDSVDPLEGMAELKLKENEPYGEPIGLKTGVVEVIIESNWDSNGRVLVRQVDPLPMSVLSIAPSGLIPFRS